MVIDVFICVIGVSWLWVLFLSNVLCSVNWSVCFHLFLLMVVLFHCYSYLCFFAPLSLEYVHCCYSVCVIPSCVCVSDVILCDGVFWSLHSFVRFQFPPNEVYVWCAVCVCGCSLECFSL